MLQCKKVVLRALGYSMTGLQQYSWSLRACSFYWLKLPYGKRSGSNASEVAILDKLLPQSNCCRMLTVNGCWISRYLSRPLRCSSQTSRNYAKSPMPVLTHFLVLRFSSLKMNQKLMVTASLSNSKELMKPLRSFFDLLMSSLNIWDSLARIIGGISWQSEFSEAGLSFWSKQWFRSTLRMASRARGQAAMAEKQMDLTVLNAIKNIKINFIRSSQVIRLNWNWIRQHC